MKGDFSRLRFAPQKNYTSVLQQQGRVSLDSDANEQQLIDEHLRTTEAIDIIGHRGGPKFDEGFEITIQNGNSLQIGAGRYYVEGLLVENDAPLAYSQQAYLVDPSPTDQQILASLVNGGVSQIQVYLQVWRRLVTELDDCCLREPAIGQADTTARLQTVWRVVAEAPASGLNQLQNQASTTGLLPANTCCESMRPTTPTPIRGKLNASTGGASDDCSCQPTPSAGYRGLENQLYRVEIHQTGDLASATFKWSRENASVVVGITQISNNNVYVDSLGPDTNLGFSIGQWVEITSDAEEFGQPPNQPGSLYQIANISRENLCVTMQQSVAPISQTLNPRMRRWDQIDSATISGVPLSSALIPLENGIEVQFSSGYYVAGDYWLIPARTATGSIEWPPCESDGATFQPPAFIQVYEAPLACITLVNGEAFSQDCRRKFPPLTAICAEDVCYNPKKCSSLASAKTVQQAIDLLCGDNGPCTIVPKPGPGWEIPIQALKPGASADICFPIGNFPLTAPLMLSGLGDIRMTGGGPGTQIVATGIDAALVFSNCLSVHISSLFASADTVLTRAKRAANKLAPESPSLGGTLSFADCPSVTVDNCQIKCGYAEERTASCINVQNSFVAAPAAQAAPTNLNAQADAVVIPPAPPLVPGTGEVRIRHCNLLVGGNQDGILLVRVQRAHVEDNILKPYSPKKYTFEQRLQNKYFRASAIRELISSAEYVKAATDNAAKSAPAAPPAPTTAPASGTPPETPAAAPAPPPAAEPASAAVSAPAQILPRKLPLNVTIAVGQFKLQFNANPLLKDFWPTYIRQKAPQTIATNRDLLVFMKTAAKNFLIHPKTRVSNSAIEKVIALMQRADQIVMARGISVGGEGIQECRILNNSIRDAVQGITVGVSNHKEYPRVWELAGTVTISGNQIYVGLPPGAQFHARHAIFAGNVNSLVIENNFGQILNNPNQVTAEGIRVFGVMGRRVVVRHNHLVGFNTGILFDALNGYATEFAVQGPMWFLGENVAENPNGAVLPVDSIAIPSNITSTWTNNLS